MLNLKDGTLWQWDTGRKIIVTTLKGQTIDKIQYYNGIGDEAWPGTVFEEDGKIVSRIPDSLLQSPNNLVVYLMTTDEDGVKTTDSIILVVNKRAKPEGYILPELEKYEQIKATALEAQESASASALSAKNSEVFAKESAEYVGRTVGEINEIKEIADEALEKSNEANSKYFECVEATANAKEAADEANAVREEVEAGGYIESLKEMNHGEKFRTWVGTQEEYDAIEIKDPSCLYIISNDDALAIFENLKTEMKALENNLVSLRDKISGLQKNVDDVNKEIEDLSEDYIIEQGEMEVNQSLSDGSSSLVTWFYTKWASGKCKLFGHSSRYIDFSADSITDLIRSDALSFKLPFKVYGKHPFFDCSDINVWASTAYDGDNLNYATCVLWRRWQYGPLWYYIHISVDGFWKEV